MFSFIPFIRCLPAEFLCGRIEFSCDKKEIVLQCPCAKGEPPLREAALHSRIMEQDRTKFLLARYGHCAPVRLGESRIRRCPHQPLSLQTPISHQGKALAQPSSVFQGVKCLEQKVPAARGVGAGRAAAPGGRWGMARGLLAGKGQMGRRRGFSVSVLLSLQRASWMENTCPGLWSEFSSVPPVICSICMETRTWILSCVAVCEANIWRIACFRLLIYPPTKTPFRVTFLHFISHSSIGS